MGGLLLLVHSPLVGHATWDLVAAGLAGRGYRVGVPDLTGTVAAGPPYCSRQAEVIASSAAAQPAILIGHSGAGPLLGAAGALLGQARGYIFVDAGLPAPGRSWMETAPADLAAWLREMADAQGWLPPWPRWWGEEVLTGLIPDPQLRRHFAAGCPRLPLAMFEEVHPPAPPADTTAVRPLLRSMPTISSASMRLATRATSTLAVFAGRLMKGPCHRDHLHFPTCAIGSDRQRTTALTLSLQGAAMQERGGGVAAGG